MNEKSKVKRPRDKGQGTKDVVFGNAYLPIFT